MNKSEEFFAENPGLEQGNFFEDRPTNTTWQTPLTLGAKYALSRSMTVNAIARDYIIYNDANAIEETSHNFFFGAGISFLF